MIADRLRGVWKPVRGLLRRGETERKMDEELRFHLEMEAARLVRREGLGEAEARRRARAAFGPVERSGRGSGRALDASGGGAGPGRPSFLWPSWAASP
jgi:hypothetical protein